jgi:hypothetical protein
MPCYRCGARQADPDPGKPSSWHQGVAAGHQVLVCPDCYPAALPELAGCSRCGGSRLVRRLGQTECLDCHLTLDDDAVEEDAAAEAAVPAPRAADAVLAAEVASALERLLRDK